MDGLWVEGYQECPPPQIGTFHGKLRDFALADPRGAPGTCAPRGPNSFIFMQFSAKN